MPTSTPVDIPQPCCKASRGDYPTGSRTYGRCMWCGELGRECDNAEKTGEVFVESKYFANGPVTVARYAFILLGPIRSPSLFNLRCNMQGYEPKHPRGHEPVQGVQRVRGTTSPHKDLDVPSRVRMPHPLERGRECGVLMDVNGPSAFKSDD